MGAWSNAIILETMLINQGILMDFGDIVFFFCIFSSFSHPRVAGSGADVESVNLSFCQRASHFLVIFSYFVCHFFVMFLLFCLSLMFFFPHLFCISQIESYQND